MSTPPRNPEFVAALVRAALIEAVLIGLGMFLYFRLNSIWALLIPVVAGSGIFLFFAAQAGMFTRPK